MRYYPMLHRIKNEVNSSVVYCGFVRYANMGYPSSRVVLFNYYNSEGTTPKEKE